jgi:molybdopterin-dependent oxidoreductase alpha subunit
MSRRPHFESDDKPSGGWGSVSEVTTALGREHVLLKGSRVLAHQNKPDGFACVSCSWAKPARPHVIEACENGIKATAWEISSRHVPARFFADHSLRELENWSDLELEAQGRLTTPLRWDADSDHYVAVGWDEAFAAIGAQLRGLDPQSTVFYASGRASLESAYMYQLLARLYGHNNLPDSSNMCHESTSVGLPQTIGVPVGTVVLDDFAQADAIFFFGQNVGTNSPRMLHLLQEARQRGVPIVTFNPLRERGLVSFVDPLSPAQMLSGTPTVISTQYHQVRIGGDIAAITGICKALLERDDAACEAGIGRVLDTAFIEQHTGGVETFLQFVRSSRWESLERQSGLTRAALTDAASVYAQAKSVIAIYGMGLTQHRHGVQNVQMVSNLLLLRGNIGRPGAGICPVRGHSNVQGQRTVGITEKPELAPLDRLREQYGFEPPRSRGRNTVETCEGVIDGSVRAFIGLGGNFVRAVPETRRVEAAWRKLALSVQIATRLNRSHIIHGESAWLLPCLGRIEIDKQGGKPQAVTVEDSTGCMHGSRGVARPAASTLRSEPFIIAGIAKATLSANPRIDWDGWVSDYARIRDAIAATYPEIFHDFNERMWTPGGFRRPLPAARREWHTPTSKANFIVPSGFDEDPDMPAAGAEVLRLQTMRSDNQFNTTIYSLDDRFRGVYGTRKVLLINEADLRRLGFAAGDMVTAETVADDGIERAVGGLRLVPFDIPAGCVAGYYPECNPLLPLWHHAQESYVPAAKSIPIRLRRETLAPAAAAH